MENDKIINYKYKTKGVCAWDITVRIEDGFLTGLEFDGGCDGNMHAIRNLVLGMKAEDVIIRLRGIDCEGRGTSCPDQLSRALEEALKTNDKGEEDIA